MPLLNDPRLWYGRYPKPELFMAELMKEADPDKISSVIADQVALLGSESLYERIHNNFKLMDEIERCKKVLGSVKKGAPNETLLVLDSTTGLNMLNQAREFNDYIGITGLVLTKLDGTARGGAVVGVVQELGIPIKFIGVGETVDDLQPFDAKAFVDGILS